MKLREIELKNFRQFYGTQKVRFSTDVNKNVTLIHAENGTGKTAFLNAILWCFFEQVTENFPAPSKLINKIAKSEGQTSYSVSIEFEDEDGKVYKVIRSRDSLSDAKFRLFRIDGYEYEEVTNPDSFINSVIPKDISKYFFFQGEGIGRMSGAKSGSKVKHAVREILGFTIAEKAIEDLKGEKRGYQKRLSAADKGGEIAKIQDEIRKLEEDIDRNDGHLLQASEAIQAFETKIDNINKQLERSNSSVVRELNSRRVGLERQLRNEQSRLEESEKGRIDLISDFAMTVFGYKLATQALDFIDEGLYKGTIPAPYNEQLIKDIIEQAKCICGAELKAGSEAIESVRELLGKAGDPRLESRVSKARSQLTAMKSDAKKARRQFDFVKKGLSSSEEAIETVKRDLDEISVQLKDTASLEDIGELERQRERYKQDQRQSVLTLGRLESEISSAKKRLQKLEPELNRLAAKSAEVARFQELVKATQDIEDVLENTVASAWSDAGIRIIEKVNTHLRAFVRQEYTAKLDPNTFEIKLHDSQGLPVAASDGQALLLSLTFISALISFSRDRRNAKGRILTPGAVAPFVIDAPFGVLDNTYKSRIAKAIPESVDQVVFLLSSSHWVGQVDEGIRQKVGCEYNMVLEDTSAGSGKGADHIEINGQKYDTVRYNCQIEKTVIEQVGDYV